MFNVRLIRTCEILLTGFLLWKIVDGTSKWTKFCPRETVDGGECEMNSFAERLVCTNNLVSLDGYKNAKTIYFCSWSDSRVNPDEILNNFPLVRKLAITNGNVTEFVTDFPRSSSLRHLTLSNLQIRALRPTIFFFLENLEFLDLTGNRLRGIPLEIARTFSYLSKIVLTGNPWNCSGNFDWILNRTIGSKIQNKSHLLCGEGIYSGKPLYTVASFIQKMKKDCPRPNCSCVMNNIVWNTRHSHLIPVITVNCSNRGITELPEKLPVNTTTLILNGNNISNLLPLIHNVIYTHVADIYLDRNHVESIDVLESALWLKNFRVLSLRENNLTQIPIYALDNAFEKNTNVAKLYLGSNPWKCDCSFTPDFQSFLIKYRTLVKDKDDVTCAYQKDDENSNLQITTVSTNSLCRKISHSINPLDVLSSVFAFLILLIVGNLLYDWWTFKRTGKLPWLAAKMPW